jgi:hypothetical protein
MGNGGFSTLQNSEPDIVFVRWQATEPSSICAQFRLKVTRSADC